jgi:prevent-host-death family protein
MIRRVNALEARKNLGTLLEGAFYKGNQYVIERAGRPMAALVPVSQLRAWQERRSRFFAALDEVAQKTRGIKPAVVEHEVAEAVTALRAKTRRRRA